MKPFPLGYLSSRRNPAYQMASRPSTPYTEKPDSLYRRISLVGAPTDSVVPILDQWVQEGRNVDKRRLRDMIRELKFYRRYKHALEISRWMTDKRYSSLTAGDVATRMNLMTRVHGIEELEKYFNGIPQRLKNLDVYIALLNCYAHIRSVEKAEDAMQKLRDMGYRKPLAYNILMNLYYRAGSREKMDCLMHEMDEKGIYIDVYTLNLHLSAYAAASDSEGIVKILTRMESDPRIVLDCYAYAAAAYVYSKLGLVEKALEIIKKLEGLIPTSKRRTFIFDCLLGLCVSIGRKDELYRIWELYKKEKIFNKGYISMLSALMTFDDIEGAEMIFEEWELRGLSYNFRIPNFLIGAYCRRGHLGKAEALVNKGIVKGVDPPSTTWYIMAGGYISDNQVPKAVEALKKAISVCPPDWKPRMNTMVACLEFLERHSDVEVKDEFARSLEGKGVFTEIVRDNLLGFVKAGKSESRANCQMEENSIVSLMPFQISQWMTDKRYIPLTPGDVATRMHLMTRVHGIEELENYFKNIPQQLKDLDVYIALLNCYALVRSAEKAEDAMQKLRDIGYRKPLAYNILMNLYYLAGSWEKMDCLMQEMDEKGIYFDVYTLTLRLSAYSAASDREGIDKILKRMESDPRIVMDCDAYAAAANGYLKLGLVEKALEITKKLEGLIPTSKKRTFTLDCLLRLYAWTGKKDELYRIWELYKKEKILNKGYISMLSALNILDDIEGAEMIFEEWELRGLSYDFRIPNFLIAAYCRHGHLSKAEALVDKWVVKGVDPLSSTWFTLAGGYIADNQVPKAVEALKKAICVCPPNWKPRMNTMVACLEFLERHKDVEVKQEFARSLEGEGVFTGFVRDKLLGFVKDGKSESRANSKMEEDVEET
ncbi:hypothetical protein RJ640_030103 [Escallonia rubra]|uniref:Pentatricopeptide repeat-containing protein n=1 Tax=Escallonia rubra TaxID=112253 RepID=A0AA88UAZ6_9ASTE|nr:hypothetical protein RJ640_030103 [Escallonia rubra]